MIDKSVLEITLQTCNKTEIPPNPSKKEARIILMDKCFSVILQIILRPLVNSKIPQEKPLQNFVGMCKKLNIGDNKSAKTSNK